MDEDKIKNRLKRYVDVSSATSAMAFRYLTQNYLGFEQNSAKNAQDLKNILGNLKGPIMKVAQFLATIPQALPPEYSEILSQLQSQAPAMGWSFVKRRMISELGPQWQQNFPHFDQNASAAASLGQVHYARDLQENELACKLQYPDMLSTVNADLNQLSMLFFLYEKWGNAIDTTQISHEIKERLLQELDYRQEARNAKLYGDIFQNYDYINIPKIYEDLSTDRLLTMQWCAGQSFDDVLAQSNQEQRDILGKYLFHTWYYPLYHYGVIHGDPHPGNYKFVIDSQTNPKINLLDFGCIRIFKPKFVQAVIDLYRGLQTNDTDRQVHAYEQWGFTNLNKEIIEIMNNWAHLLYEPLLDDRVRPIKNADAGALGWETATKVHAALSKAGGITPPKEFVFMDRAAVGIGSVIMRLNAQQNWHQIFESLIEWIDSQTLEQNQQRLGIINH